MPPKKKQKANSPAFSPMLFVTKDHKTISAQYAGRAPSIERLLDPDKASRTELDEIARRYQLRQQLARTEEDLRIADIMYIEEIKKSNDLDFNKEGIRLQFIMRHGMENYGLYDFHSSSALTAKERKTLQKLLDKSVSQMKYKVDKPSQDKVDASYDNLVNSVLTSMGMDAEDARFIKKLTKETLDAGLGKLGIDNPRARSALYYFGFLMLFKKNRGIVRTALSKLMNLLRTGSREATSYLSRVYSNIKGRYGPALGRGNIPNIEGDEIPKMFEIGDKFDIKQTIREGEKTGKFKIDDEFEDDEFEDDEFEDDEVEDDEFEDDEVEDDEFEDDEFEDDEFENDVVEEDEIDTLENRYDEAGQKIDDLDSQLKDELAHPEDNMTDGKHYPTNETPVNETEPPADIEMTEIGDGSDFFWNGSAAPEESAVTDEASTLTTVMEEMAPLEDALGAAGGALYIAGEGIALYDFIHTSKVAKATHETIRREEMKYNAQFMKETGRRNDLEKFAGQMSKNYRSLYAYYGPEALKYLQVRNKIRASNPNVEAKLPPVIDVMEKIAKSYQENMSVGSFNGMVNESPDPLSYVLPMVFKKGNHYSASPSFKKDIIAYNAWAKKQYLWKDQKQYNKTMMSYEEYTEAFRKVGQWKARQGRERYRDELKNLYNYGSKPIDPSKVNKHDESWRISKDKYKTYSAQEIEQQQKKEDTEKTNAALRAVTDKFKRSQPKPAKHDEAPLAPPRPVDISNPPRAPVDSPPTLKVPPKNQMPVTGNPRYEEAVTAWSNAWRIAKSEWNEFDKNYKAGKVDMRHYEPSATTTQPSKQVPEKPPNNRILLAKSAPATATAPMAKTTTLSNGQKIRIATEPKPDVFFSPLPQKKT